jgi:DNA-directed RNA polymerase specialized sigma24 family protein
MEYAAPNFGPPIRLGCPRRQENIREGKLNGTTILMRRKESRCRLLKSEVFKSRPSSRTPCLPWSPSLTARKADLSRAISTGHIIRNRQFRSKTSFSDLTLIPVRCHALGNHLASGVISESEACPMSSRELSPDWILSAFYTGAGPRTHDISELAVVARNLWPRVQAHALRELPNTRYEDSIALATAVWEAVLQSVAKTIHRTSSNNRPILDLEGYLFGAFHHRFNRALRKERRRREVIRHLPQSRDLERLRHAHDSQAVKNLDRSIQVKQAIESMDHWTRKVWMARQAGYSWREIAKHLRLTEPQAKLRFRYAIGRICARFRNGM